MSERVCWDCGGREFRLIDGDDAELLAVCANCDGRLPVAHLYRSDDEIERERYAMEMGVAVDETD